MVASYCSFWPNYKVSYFSDHGLVEDCTTKSFLDCQHCFGPSISLTTHFQCPLAYIVHLLPLCSWITYLKICVRKLAIVTIKYFIKFASPNKHIKLFLTKANNWTNMFQSYFSSNHSCLPKILKYCNLFVIKTKQWFGLDSLTKLTTVRLDALVVKHVAIEATNSWLFVYIIWPYLCININLIDQGKIIGIRFPNLILISYWAW